MPVISFPHVFCFSRGAFLRECVPVGTQGVPSGELLLGLSRGGDRRQTGPQAGLGRGWPREGGLPAEERGPGAGAHKPGRLWNCECLGFTEVPGAGEAVRAGEGQVRVRARGSPEGKSTVGNRLFCCGREEGQQGGEQSK